MAASESRAVVRPSPIKAVAHLARFLSSPGNLRMAGGQLGRQITGRAFIADKPSADLNGEVYRQLWREAQSLAPAQFVSIHQRADQIIEDHSEQLTRTLVDTRARQITVADCCHMISLPDADGRLLYQMVRRYGLKQILELGGAFGIGTRYLAMALRDNDQAAGITEPSGTVYSLEIDEWRCEIAREGLGDLAPYVRVIAASCEDGMPGLAKEHRRFDMAFFDALHQRDANLDYFRLLCAMGAERCWCAFHDVNYWPKYQAWRRIVRDGRVSGAARHRRVGLLIVEPD